MIILTIRTDKPESEIGLYEDSKQLTYEKWEAHRALAETLHIKIRAMLDSHNFDWSGIEGIAAYEGPGSFTGLRIGISSANALAYANQISIVGSSGDDWAATCIKKLMEKKGQKQIVPDYGAEAHITVAKK